MKQLDMPKKHLHSKISSFTRHLTLVEDEEPDQAADWYWRLLNQGTYSPDTGEFKHPVLE